MWEYLKSVPGWVLAAALAIVAILLVFVATTNRTFVAGPYPIRFESQKDLGVWRDVSTDTAAFDFNCEYRLILPAGKVGGEDARVTVTFVAAAHLFAHFKTVQKLTWLQIDSPRKHIAAADNGPYDVQVRTLERCSGPPRV